MIKKLSALLAVAAFIGGCGSSSSSSSTASSSSAPATSSSTTAAASSSSASASSGGSAIANNPAVKAAVAACKSRIAAAPGISADAKAKLTGLCDQAASGNESGVLKAAAQVCQEIVKQSVPQAAQQQALASCPKA